MADSYTASEDATLNVSVPGVLGNDTDADGDTLTAVVVTGPSHGSLALNTDGSFSYSPVANFNGPDSFTYKANDGTADSNIATVSIAVAAVNDAPVAANGTLTTTEDTPASGTLVATDGDGDALTYAIVGNGTKGSAAITNAATGAFTYTPNANANGLDSITFKANDGTADSNIATIAIAITAVNDAPVASDGSLTTLEDTPASGTLVASDVDGDALTYAIVGNGTKGSATITNVATGAFTYTPNANANGTDSITFKASDGTVDSNTATVSITITAGQRRAGGRRWRADDARGHAGERHAWSPATSTATRSPTRSSPTARRAPRRSPTRRPAPSPTRRTPTRTVRTALRSRPVTARSTRTRRPSRSRSRRSTTRRWPPTAR